MIFFFKLFVKILTEIAEFLCEKLSTMAYKLQTYDNHHKLLVFFICDIVYSIENYN